MTPIPMTKFDIIHNVQLQEARILGKDISYEDADRHIEAYEFNGQIYIGEVSTLPERR